jgi:3',5'-cyclic AMP phosphodiesterase CpdA
MNGLRLLHYSDPHFGACDHRIAKAAVETARRLAPDFTVVSGDFSMRGRRFEFSDARDWLAQLPEPLLAYPGNHDVPGLNHIADRFFSPFRRYRKYISEIEEPTAMLGDVGAIATANSSTPFGLHLDWSRGFLSPIQTQGLNSFYEEMEEGHLRVFGMHHPVVGSGEKARALVAPMALVNSFFQTSKIDLLLAGHFHQSKICLFPDSLDSSGDSRCIVVSQAPSICSTRLKGEPNGFHLLTLGRDAITIELWRWGVGGFQAESSRSFVRCAQGWSSAP